MHARRICIAACGAALVAGGGRGESPQAPLEQPPPDGGVRVVDATTIENVEEVPGRVQAYRTAEVRARVDGIVQRRLYEEGTNVEEGQELFLIDPREMRAAVNAAEAALARAEAEVENARQEVERYDELL